MKTFTSDGFRIAYDDEGSGYPVFLLHGFAADRRNNWRLTGWTKLLLEAGYRVVAADARGHGRSDKPNDPACYAPEGIAGDTVRLMDHLGIESASVFGYSMGARNAAWLLCHREDRLDSAIIGGMGDTLLTSEANEAAASLAMPRLVPVYEKLSAFKGRAGALSACLLGSFPSLPASDFEAVTTPTLVIVGSKDTTAGSPDGLAAAIPGAKSISVPGRSHLSVIVDGYFKGAVMGFLADQSSGRPSPSVKGGGDKDASSSAGADRSAVTG